MAYLLDTSVVLWALNYPERIGMRTTKILKGESLFISVASLWEITIKVRAGRLRVPLPVQKVLDLLGATELPITTAHIDQLMEIKLPHKDPFDAILVAQAKTENISLLTTDRQLLESPYTTLSAKS